MPVTIQEVIDRARLDINDPTTNTAIGAAIDPRNTDADLLKFANDGMAKACVMRPDLRFGNYGTAFTDLVATSSFPFPIEYRPAIAAYVVARVESGDDAFVNSGRADLEMKRYLNELGLT